MNALIEQLKQRRIALGLKQHDMLLRMGMSRQQYQRLESKGNPRLDTLVLIAKGLKSEILLIPQEKLNAVKALLEDDEQSLAKIPEVPAGNEEENSLADNPWKDLLEEDTK